MINDDSLSDLPDELVNRAISDPDFAARLLHVTTRKEALSEIGVEADYHLDSRLDEIANMSMREAMTKLRGRKARQA